MNVEKYLKPLLKWAGGKRFLAPAIRSLFEELGPSTYFEPFAGGAALFFELSHQRAVLSDTNADLINFYRVVKDSPAELIARLKRMQNCESEYYRIRDSRPVSDIGRAARLYYLVRLSFNGIYRENLNGEFNVPYGQKAHLSCADTPTISAASTALQRANLYCRDFRKIRVHARKRDIIYFDPPYTVRHNNNGFIKYNRRLFNWSDQEMLATVANELAMRGCYVVVSNADHRDILALYPGFSKMTISRFSVISAQNHGRTQTTEALFLSKNLPRHIVEDVTDVTTDGVRF